MNSSATKTTSGYVGLLALLITVMILVFLAWRSDLFMGGSKDKKTTVEEGLKGIDDANVVKNMMEQNNKKALQEIPN